MAKSFTPILVVAAALRASDGRWLMHCRPSGKAHAGLWEFPGGKVEEPETPSGALVRELKEESGLVVQHSALEEVGFAISGPDQPDSAIVLLLYTATEWSGVLEAREGGKFAWFDKAGVEALSKPPLDVILSGRLFDKYH